MLICTYASTRNPLGLHSIRLLSPRLPFIPALSPSSRLPTPSISGLCVFFGLEDGSELFLPSTSLWVNDHHPEQRQPFYLGRGRMVHSSFSASHFLPTFPPLSALITAMSPAFDPPRVEFVPFAD
jgi:hypothetical protein